jgi:hypothetical protein
MLGGMCEIPLSASQQTSKGLLGGRSIAQRGEGKERVKWNRVRTEWPPPICSEREPGSQACWRPNRRRAACPGADGPFGLGWSDLGCSGVPGLSGCPDG